MATPTATPTAEQLQAELQAVLNGPAASPPAGVTPNFNDPPNLNRVVAVVLTLCIFLPTVAVLLRLYTKKFLIQSWAYEDCETPISSFPNLTASLISTRRSHTRMGKSRQEEALLFLLTSAAWSNCTEHSVWTYHAAWCGSTHMECTDEDLLHIAIREFRSDDWLILG